MSELTTIYGRSDVSVSVRVMYGGVKEREVVEISVLESTTASGELYSSADDNIEQRHRCMNRSGHPDDLWPEDRNNLSVQPTLGSQ